MIYDFICFILFFLHFFQMTITLTLLYQFLNFLYLLLFHFSFPKKNSFSFSFDLYDPVSVVLSFVFILSFYILFFHTNNWFSFSVVVTSLNRILRIMSTSIRHKSKPTSLLTNNYVYYYDPRFTCMVMRIEKSHQYSVA